MFSALAALGFAILFSVPARLVWACMICGIASHTLRALLFHHGIDLIAGSLIGALAVGLLAQLFARRFKAPAVAFAFPGVVAMIPGVYAFRGVIGAVAIARGTTDPALITDTLSLLFTVLLMVGGIAIGIGAPMLLIPPRASPHLVAAR